MKIKTPYIAKPVNPDGIVSYTPEENHIWQQLITRQLPLIRHRACPQYVQGLDKLNFPHDKVPQSKDISVVLRDTTGWALEPVPALIPDDYFFQLLANRKFPAATFIRSQDELDYLQEPDIFHETFGHCPLLTNQAIADFTHTYGKLGLNACAEDREMLVRLYWFTIEFGLMKTAQGLRSYGAGILSSFGESSYSLESPLPERRPFDILEVLRTPYRIDIMQPIYFVIDSFDTLFELVEIDLISLIHKARTLGMYAPVFEPIRN
ncbi:MAG: phenylalanine 4-monooxygenase [Gammaproteobacteria bacterium]